jgi:superfamily II DNA or RNA helicase
MPKHYRQRTDGNQTVIALQDYQQSLIQGVYEQWTQHQRVIAQLPTGGGKTVIFAAIAHWH